MENLDALFHEAQDEVASDMAWAQAEVRIVQEQIVMPGWTGPLHGMPRTLYGYMMSCFSSIDLLSQYLQGGSGSQGQSVRMVAFMDQYLGYEHSANAVALQLWRHTLMHTANPRRVRGVVSGTNYRWLLHWGSPYLPADQHMTFQKPAADDWILGVGLNYLVDDLAAGASKLFAAAQQDEELKVKIAKAHAHVLRQTVRDL